MVIPIDPRLIMNCVEGFLKFPFFPSIFVLEDHNGDSSGREVHDIDSFGLRLRENVLPLNLAFHLSSY